jgi:pimeloyl-ACP methyl ester carboxylesterase
MSATASASNATAPNKYLEVGRQRYAYRRFGERSSAPPLLLLQHFTGTLDNWDPAITDPLAAEREVILFDNAGVGRSTGDVPQTVGGMATHALAFLDALGVARCDVLGFSLGGMVAQQLASDRPAIVRRMILAGTAPRGGENIMHVNKPSLAKYFGDASLHGKFARLPGLFFALSPSSQAAARAFVDRLERRTEDQDLVSGPKVAQAQVAAFRDWERFDGQRFDALKAINLPTLVVHGIYDEMIPVSNAYWLSQNLPDAVLMTYPDSAHGCIFQFHQSFTRQAAAFLASGSAFAPY